MNKLITFSSALFTTTAINAQSPNIIFILADDLGHTSAYTSPYIEKLTLQNVF